MKRLDNRGTTMIEYALIVSLITLVAIASLRTLSNAVGGQSNSVSNKITDALDGGPTGKE